MTLSFQPLWPVLLFLWTTWLTVLPGYFIAHLTWRNRLNLYEKLGVSFALGFLVFSFLGLLGYLFSLPLDTLFWASSLITLLLGLGVLLTCIFRRFPVTAKAKKLDWKIGMILIIAALLGALISWGSGWYPRGDAAIHLQAIRKIINHAAITQPIYSLDTKPVLWDHAYDTYYLLIALITKHSGLDLAVVWHYLSGVLALLLPFVIYALLKALRASKRLVFNGLVFFLLISMFYPRPMYGTVFDALVYPNRVFLWLLLPIALAFFFRYLTYGKRTDGFTAALVAAFQLLIHQNGFLFYYWILGGVFLIGLMLRRCRRVIVRGTACALGLVTALSLPLLLLKWPYNRVFVRLATLPAQWHTYYEFWSFNKQFYAFDPSMLWHLDMVAGLVIAAVAIYRAIRRHPFELPLTEMLLGAGFFVPLLVVFNPVLMPAVAKIFSYTSVGRMLRIPVYYLAYAYGVEVVFAPTAKFIKNDRAQRAFKVSGYLIVCSMFLFVATPGYSVFQKLSFYHQLPPIVRVVDHLKPGSLVLSDPLTSTDIVEFADVYTLVMQFNGPVDLVDITAGRRVVDEVFHQTLSLTAVTEILKKEEIDYIVVDKRSGLSEDIGEDYPSLLTTVYYDQNYELYKVDLGEIVGELP